MVIREEIQVMEAWASIQHRQLMTPTSSPYHLSLLRHQSKIAFCSATSNQIYWVIQIQVGSGQCSGGF